MQTSTQHTSTAMVPSPAPKPSKGGNPRRRALLMAAGLWPVPPGMDRREATRLARAKLQLGKAERADRNRAGFLALLRDYRASADEAEAERIKEQLMGIMFAG